MAPRRLNVLVYTGTGSSAESVRQCMHALRRLLPPSWYAVAAVGEAALVQEPWAATCALLVLPGGADLGYSRVLNGEGNRRIADYVLRGGAYLGLCAGAYYGSARCEFEVGKPPLEVVGPRELAFFPGTCRGAAFADFQYRSEAGARAARLAVNAAAFEQHVPQIFASYYNGGGAFVEAEAVASREVEVLASYCDQLNVDPGHLPAAAVVLCHVGDGRALLSGPHPEFAAAHLSPHPDVPGYDKLIDRLAADDQARITFLKACLTRLGLEVSQDDTATPRLSPLHLSAIDHTAVTDLVCALDDIIHTADGKEFITGEADTFILQRWSNLVAADDRRQTAPAELLIKDDGSLDFGATIKTINAHELALPPAHCTPHFNYDLYYSSLRRFRAIEEDAVDWGSVLLYGEVVTSTNSLLEKNAKLTSKLPDGFILAASRQLAGRGRGSNTWVAPPGALMFSTVIHHPAHLASSRPVVFLQYAAAIAVVEAIKSLGPGYRDLSVKLKWPNDIYALDPTKPAAARQYVKIGGLLSHCSYCDGAYQIVLGIGINATNPQPTTSLAAMLAADATPLRLEVLLARIVTHFESVHAQFRREGFSGDLETRYYRHWLHTGQPIVLDAEGGIPARVLGITRDWGMLRVEETDADDRVTGKIWSLQSDENSFDFWKGLVRRKL